MTQLRAWEQDCKDLAKLEGHEMVEFTKRTIFKKMLPADMVRDLERDKELKGYTKAWLFVLEQVPLRKDWKALKKNPNDMDVDAVELVPPGTQVASLSPSAAASSGSDVPHDGLCPPCEGEDSLFTMKGGGKGGVFQGYCGFCGLWGTNGQIVGSG